MTPSLQNGTMSLLSIWTDETSAQFYETAKDLLTRVGGKGAPRAPKDYRSDRTRAPDTGIYALLYEEELHLADNIAFLAHNQEGVGFVSAAAIEESADPPLLTVRLASNQTPQPSVVQGLSTILGIVEEHAIQGRLFEIQFC